MDILAYLGNTPVIKLRRKMVIKDVIDLIINISLESLNHYIFDILNEDGILYDSTLKKYDNINTS